jgi:hypothetical protein
MELHEPKVQTCITLRAPKDVGRELREDSEATCKHEDKKSSEGLKLPDPSCST